MRTLGVCPELLKKSAQPTALKGHDFSRAVKDRRMSVGLSLRGKSLLQVQPHSRGIGKSPYLRCPKLATCIQQIRRNWLSLFKYVPKKAPRYEEKPHPTLPPQLFPSLHKPIRQHPKRPDTRDNVNDNWYAKQQWMIVGNVEEEPQMQDIHRSDCSHSQCASMYSAV